MSLLNLNTSAGRGPRSKKSLKMFMGAGLLVAVLGIGSTLASDIILNGPELTTEFGQGVTQTVYCGGDESVTITPLSSYRNSSRTVQTPGSNQEVATIRWGGSSNESETSKPSGDSWPSEVTINSASSSNPPLRWTGNNTAKTGWWLATSRSTSPLNPQPTAQQVATNASTYFFAVKTDTNKFRRASSSGWGISTDVVVWKNAVVEVVSTSDASFKFSGVKISDIPSNCDGVDFVVSVFGSTGEAKTLVSAGGVSVKEVAAYWDGSPLTTDTSILRDKLEKNTNLVTSAQDSDWLKFNFTISDSNTLLTASDVNKIVVETQQDVLKTN